eukprot:TRINITY_DN22677_c0_g1_i1.p1 TRINITY_DN22677_c0_g1~~TRINITY_DN22677_c0_g1_i1.p1  ORF type:complete len:594 (+),score=90.69 TRINITY_DN22677_c0_g1_i1:116-1897(+)
MVEGGALAGRTVHEVSDLSVEEQLYLYERTRRFKAQKQIEQGGATSSSAQPLLYEIQDQDESEQVASMDSTVYLLFMENSTRTRESLRNAAVYHGVKVNEFQADSSSFKKNETITDTMKMLSVYSTQRTVFVIRSQLEGVCSWLDTVMPAHAEKFGLPRPVFLNAGDGVFSHPLGELNDIFSLLERNKWDRSAVHLALVGDLAHGRTAHSKVEGLKVFKKVRVDLVAPEIFSYPVEYVNRMRENGFEVREFASVQEYLEQSSDSVANVWYFYKPNYKRCGDIGTVRISELADQVSFKAEWLDKLPKDCGFFQTLPRDKESPIIPLSFDTLPINSWDTVASNAYFIDVILLGMLFGKIGQGLPKIEPSVSAKAWAAPRSVFSADGKDLAEGLPAFIQAVDVSKNGHERDVQRVRAGGVVPISDGLIVDHIGSSNDSSISWERLRMVRTILGWSNYIGSEGVCKSSSTQKGAYKGIMALPNFDFASLQVTALKILAAVAPGCTINCISGSKVVAKYRVQVPTRIYNLPNISCKNSLCVANPVNKQRDVNPHFYRVPFYQSSVLPVGEAAEYLFVCKYCKWPHFYDNLWTTLYTKD